MILLNAVYFKGEWEVPFNKNDTHLKDFMNSGKVKKKVEMMLGKGSFKYYEQNEIQAIKLPYKKDHFQALVILPPKNVNLNSFIQSDLNQNLINEIIKGTKKENVILILPKFQLANSISLVDSLGKMGMQICFSQEANFCGMRKEKDIYIGDVLHKTFLKVDELGTEAAAVTAVDMRLKCRKKEIEFKEMTVNRPFFFFIINERLPENNQLLFMSKIEKL